MNKRKGVKNKIKMQKSKILIILGVLIIAIGVGGFFAGMKYQQSKLPQGLREREMRARDGQIVRRSGANMIRGEIISKDDESITVKQADDSSKIVLLSENTTISKSQEGTVDDLKEGAQVIIFGQENSDKSITAQNVQLNPLETRLPPVLYND